GQRKEMFSEAYQVEKRRREEQERQQNLEIIWKNIAEIIDNCEGEHQSDAYWVLGSHYPLCRGNHMSLDGSGIPLDKVLKAYPENAVPDQPIVWNYTLKFPDKSIA
ncbi:37211_t:CDS:2, partial [Gigaspora margarita]